MPRGQAKDFIFLLEMYFKKEYRYLDQVQIEFMVRELMNIFQDNIYENVILAFKKLCEENPDYAPTIPRIKATVDEYERKILLEKLNKALEEGKLAGDTEAQKMGEFVKYSDKIRKGELKLKDWQGAKKIECKKD